MVSESKESVQSAGYTDNDNDDDNEEEDITGMQFT